MSQTTMTNKRYNPPPNWPAPPAGWQPPAGWEPDPSWGEPPAGHQLWVDETPATKKKVSKKKIALGVVGGFIVLSFISNLGGGDDAAPVADTEPAAAEPAEAEVAEAEVAAPVESAPAEEPVPEPAPEPEPSTPGIGTAVRDGNFEFVVTGVERPGNTIGESFMEEEAQGEFIIVRVDVKNIGDEGQTLSSSGQVLINDKGQKFEPSSAIFALEDADKFFLENINPGNSVTGAPLLFDVAPGTVLESVELHDSMFSGGAAVSLEGS